MFLLVWNLLMPLKWRVLSSKPFNGPLPPLTLLSARLMTIQGTFHSHSSSCRKACRALPHTWSGSWRAQMNGCNSEDPARASQTASGSSFHPLPQPHSTAHASASSSMIWWLACHPLWLQASWGRSSVSPSSAVCLDLVCAWHTLTLQWWTNNGGSSNGLWEPDTVVQVLEFNPHTDSTRQAPLLPLRRRKDRLSKK